MPVATKAFDQHQGQYLPQAADVPSRIRKKAMIGIVSTLTQRIGKWQHAGDGSPRRAQNPAGHQPNENLGTRSRENWKKLLKKFRPCRNNCMHIDLPVLIVKSNKDIGGSICFCL